MEKIKLNPIATAVVRNKLKQLQLNDKEIDLLLVDNSDIICWDFKAWYCKKIKVIGISKFLQLAAQARQEGREKSRYFSYLLKNT